MADGDPVLHLLAGPNGAGKSTLADRVILRAAPGLPFVDADEIAAREALTSPEGAYEAARRAAAERDRLIAARASFVAETVFSHPSKLDVLRTAQTEGYLVTLHVVLVPVELSVARVADRVRRGGHPVPDDKIRSRHARLWSYVAEAVGLADETLVYDNSAARTPLRLLARFTHGTPVGSVAWPAWAPDELVALT